VQDARELRLAGARRSREQHAHVERADERHLGQRLRDGRAAAHEVGEPQRLAIGLRRVGLFAQPAFHQQTLGKHGQVGREALREAHLVVDERSP
jgi:hypothetical protein